MVEILRPQSLENTINPIFHITLRMAVNFSFIALSCFITIKSRHLKILTKASFATQGVYLPSSMQLTACEAPASSQDFLLVIHISVNTPTKFRVLATHVGNPNRISNFWCLPNPSWAIQIIWEVS